MTSFPRVAKAKRELEVEDEFEDDEVGIGHDLRAGIFL